MSCANQPYPGLPPDVRMSASDGAPGVQKGGLASPLSGSWGKCCKSDQECHHSQLAGYPVRSSMKPGAEGLMEECARIRRTTPARYRLTQSLLLGHIITIGRCVFVGVFRVCDPRATGTGRTANEHTCCGSMLVTPGCRLISRISRQYVSIC